MGDTHWRQLFVSRETELAWLQDAWRKAKSGDPQFLVLIGESGLGKTRLVQEFYRWLSTAEDPGNPEFPHGYWPDAFTSDAGSLHVNPKFLQGEAATIAPIPWLWWGLRWPIPDRRNEVANGCALIDYRSYLEPHIKPILAARKLREIQTEAAWKIASVAGQFITQLSQLGWLTSARDAWAVIRDDIRAEREQLAAAAAGPAEHFAADLHNLETQALETFRLILDRSIPRSPGIPAVLVLDDAQWADPVTLRFLLQLLRAALEGKWPLLVVATHWEAEWRRDVKDAPTSSEAPTQLADLPALLGLGNAWSGVRPIPPIADLGEVVTTALPGITSVQSALIQEKAGGNPRLLEEIFHHLLSHSQLFEGRDVSMPLTTRAEREIRERLFDYHDLVDERFCRLEDHVRRVLGWSSCQGVRFLASITEAIAERVAPEYDASRLRPALEEAEDPHSFIQLFRDQGRFNLGEFRQVAFQHVARENLALDERELTAVEAALRSVLASWLERVSGDGGVSDLEPSERRDVLAMAYRVFSRDDPSTRRSWALATAQFIHLHASEYLWTQALRMARELADASPTGWPLEDLAFFWQHETIRVLLHMRDLPRAGRLARSMASQLITGEARSNLAADEVRKPSLALSLLGDVELALGRREEALSAFRRSQEIAEQLLAEYGDSPDVLRDLSISLSREGEVELALGRREEALGTFRRSLDIHERLLAKYDSPEVLRDLSVSLNKLGEVELALGRREAALGTFRRSQEIDERLLAEHGDTPEALRDLSISLGRAGGVELSLGRRVEALDALRRSLDIHERLLAEYGDSPEALRDLSVSLGWTGEVELSLGRREEALGVFRRSLEIRERLLAEYGDTPEALRDLIASLVKMASVSAKSDAIQLLRRAYAITSIIVARGRAVPQTYLEWASLAEELRKLEGDAQG